jgi:diguanylate cyclase (GGDEF)-like protein/PAS domain S-box-containing protein
MPSAAHRMAKNTNAQESRPRVLLIEANASDAARILDQLGPTTHEPIQVEWVTRLSSGVKRLQHAGIAAVVLDLALPGCDGLETLEAIFEVAPGMPVLILTETGTEETARQAVQRGAHDYLIKNQADGYRLRLAVRTMIDRGAAAARFLQNEAANVTLDSMGEAVLRTDTRTHITYLNRIAEQMTGWTREQAIGRPIAQVLRIIDAVSGAVIGNQVESVLQEENSERVADYSNSVLVRRDGVERGIENTVALTHDQDGNVTGAVVAFHDVSAARTRSLVMTHLAQHDGLTNLPNRMLFNDRLTQALSLAGRQGKQLALMFVDLDHFKKINDSLGHQVGDMLLQSVAARLLACVRRTDTVSRRGGDEFVVLLSQVDLAEDAALSARNILRALAKPHIIENKSLDMNASVGISTYPDDGGNAETLITKADTAMYEAKRRGRNNFQFFRPEMQARLIERQSLESALRHALGRQEFVLHYQPKINLQTGRIAGVEALIRWVHPKRGLVYPPQFVPIAEQSGLILSIGRWVLLEACKQARAWSDLELGIVPMAVNVSSAEFRDKDFLSGVRAVLIATGVQPKNLELELTESVLMQDAESTVNTLVALKAMGVLLAIDDFGTGYSSFSYLQRFPLDALKLHQSFVQGITEDQGEAPLLNAMMNIGRSLKQRVVAEGVETRAQFDFLQRNGCDEAQGNYFSQPVGADEAGKLIQDIGLFAQKRKDKTSPRTPNHSNRTLISK